MNVAARLAAILATAGMTACAVAPGPVEQQANQAGIACQYGNYQACQHAAYLQPAANAERAQNQQAANVGTAVAAGLVGVAAGAAIASSGPRYYGRGYGYYGRGYYRGW